MSKSIWTRRTHRQPERCFGPWASLKRSKTVRYDWRRFIVTATSNVTPVTTAFSFGRFELRPTSRELMVDGQKVPLVRAP